MAKKIAKADPHKRLGILVLFGVVMVGVAVTMMSLSQIQTSTNTRAGSGNENSCKKQKGQWYSKTCAALSSGRQKYEAVADPSDNNIFNPVGASKPKYCCKLQNLSAIAGKSCDKLKGDLYTSCATVSKPKAPFIRATDEVGNFANNENGKQCCIAVPACESSKKIGTCGQQNPGCSWYSCNNTCHETGTSNKDAGCES